MSPRYPNDYVGGPIPEPPPEDLPAPGELWAFCDSCGREILVAPGPNCDQPDAHDFKPEAPRAPVEQPEDDIPF